MFRRVPAGLAIAFLIGAESEVAEVEAQEETEARMLGLAACFILADAHSGDVTFRATPAFAARFPLPVP